MGEHGTWFDYLNRFETKGAIYPLLRDRFGYRSPLNDKLDFTRHCAAHAIPTIPVIAVAKNGYVTGQTIQVNGGIYMT